MMDKMNALKNKLKQVGKFDKLSVFCELLSLQCENRDTTIFQTCNEAISVFQDYLVFDSQPPVPLKDSLTEAFSYAFKAIRFYAGENNFNEVYSCFLKLENYLTQGDAQANIYADLSFLHWVKNDFRKALDYGKKSLTILEKSDNVDILPGRYTNIGFIYECLGDYATAEDYYGKGLTFGMRVNSSRIISLAYCGFGRVNLSSSHLREAVLYFLEALKHLADTNSDDYKTVCSNLGIAYGKLGDYKESLKFFSILIREVQEKDNPDLYYSTLMNTANCYYDLGDFDKAEKNLQEIIACFDKHKNIQAISAALLNLGKIYSAQGKLTEAVNCYKKSKEQITLTGNQFQNVIADIGLGVVHHQLGENEKAIYRLKKSLDNATKLNLKSEIMKCYQKLSQIYEETNQYDKALEHYKQFRLKEMEIKDSKFNLDLENIKSHYLKKSRKPEIENLYKNYSIIPVELSKIVKTPFIGTSEAIREVVSKALLGAENDTVPVLITGESGTGKEIIARIIHYASARKNSPFTIVNSVAFTDSLVESSFFGSEKGAFTGSHERKNGYFEATQNGTLFLDEIGDMTLSMQSKLLRVLEERVINRVGSTKDISVDFRLISATNKNLYELIDQNIFRFDLLNRINILEINLPPLRERIEDIPLLVDYFLTLFGTQRECGKFILSKAALDRLYEYRYPGNVRELKNIIQRSVLLSKKTILEEEDIIMTEKSTENSEKQNLQLSSLNLAEWEKHLIKNAMTKAGNVQAKASILLGISPYALNRKLKKLDEK